MTTEWMTLTSGALPLDGSEMETAIPPSGAPVRLTLRGELVLPQAGAAFDAVDADTPSSLIQIEPGRWHMIEADPDAHAYVFVPTTPLTTPATLSLDLQALAERFHLPPAEVGSALTGELSVELAGGSTSTVLSTLAAPLAGTALALLVAATVALRRLRSRRARDEDLDRLLQEIHELADALNSRTGGHTNAGPKATRDLPALVASAERLRDSTRVLRRRLDRRRVGALRTRVERLGRKDKDAPDRKEAERRLAMLEPLVAEESRLAERLQRIRDALKALLDAWTAVDAAGEERGVEIQARLDEAEAEITAVLATKLNIGGGRRMDE